MLLLLISRLQVIVSFIHTVPTVGDPPTSYLITKMCLRPPLLITLSHLQLSPEFPARLQAPAASLLLLPLISLMKRKQITNQGTKLSVTPQTTHAHTHTNIHNIYTHIHNKHTYTLQCLLGLPNPLIRSVFPGGQ